tara:strand:+ start:962 stop:1426 length:465 start_codon:yes stop_codon:yes gene_type:complete
MFELGEFYLELALVCPRPLGKDIENHTGTVQHTALELMLNVAFLARTQGMIEQDNISLIGRHCVTNFFQLALTDEKSGTGLLPGPRDGTNRLNTGGGYKLPKFTRVFGAIVGSKIDVDEYCALTDIRTFKQLASTPGNQTMGDIKTNTRGHKIP